MTLQNYFCLDKLQLPRQSSFRRDALESRMYHAIREIADKFPNDANLEITCRVSSQLWDEFVFGLKWNVSPRGDFFCLREFDILKDNVYTYNDDSYRFEVRVSEVFPNMVYTSTKNTLPVMQFEPFACSYKPRYMDIKKVIFNDPATIVYWKDGTKTVVKVQDGDTWDPEKGLAMAFIKKKMGLKKFYKVYDKFWRSKHE